jgi:serine/threonine protein kinase
MKAFPHPLIVKLIDNFKDSEGHLCLVLERYNDGDFSKYLNDRQGELLSEKEILRFLANISLAVFHINSRDIFHRDLKPANFLKKDVNGKIYLHLSDFGLSKNIRDVERDKSSTNNVKGTLEYLSPESH